MLYDASIKTFSFARTVPSCKWVPFYSTTEHDTNVLLHIHVAVGAVVERVARSLLKVKPGGL